MKIGDEVFVHGYVDEIRKDAIIIRNDGGYFGTVKGEVVVADTPQTDFLVKSPRISRESHEKPTERE